MGTLTTVQPKANALLNPNLSKTINDDLQKHAVTEAQSFDISLHWFLLLYSVTARGRLAWFVRILALKSLTYVCKYVPSEGDDYQAERKFQNMTKYLACSTHQKPEEDAIIVGNHQRILRCWWNR